MKRKINVIVTLLVSLVLSACCMLGCGKGKATAVVKESTATRVVIEVSEAEENATLLSVMEKLQKDEKLTFTLSGTMVTGVNGKENATDFSSCWMLYTSDTEMSNTEWGTIEYDGKTLASAIVGADTLTVISGGVYIWEYQTF